MITVYGQKTTQDDLAKIIPTTPEGAGRRWRAIPHGELVETIKDECSTRGWRITKELYSTGREGADLAGALLLEGVGGVAVPGGQQLALGFLNSNARRKALQVTVGTSVAVCNNGMCSGNILMSQVHDHSFDLVDEVDTALDRYVLEAGGLVAGIEGLRERELAPAEASEILLAAGRAKMVGWAAVGRVDAEYRKPTFSDFGVNNSWALLNAFTYAARQNINPMRQMETYQAFRKLLPVAEVAGLTA
jgi:hypothetical protein